MKKITIILVIILFLLTQVYAQVEGGVKKKDGKKTERIVTTSVHKTYILKHALPSDVCAVLKPYLYQQSYSDSSMMLTVVMPKKSQKIFEEILKKMDVKKKNIKLTIYTIIGKSEGSSKSAPIKNKNLASVLDKLNNLMNFKTFILDGVSFLPLKDGQRSSKLKLSSKSSRLQLTIANVQIKGDKKEGREVKFNFKFWDSKLGDLIRTETSVKEDGYLIAGVSKIGKNGDSLILIISAEIGKWD